MANSKIETLPDMITPPPAPPACILDSPSILETWNFISLLYSEFDKVAVGDHKGLNDVRLRIGHFLFLALKDVASQVQVKLEREYPEALAARNDTIPEVKSLVLIKKEMRLRFVRWSRPVANKERGHMSKSDINNNDTVQQILAQDREEGDNAETLWWLRLAVKQANTCYEKMAKWEAGGKRGSCPIFMLSTEPTPHGSWEFILKAHKLIQGYKSHGPAAAKKMVEAMGINIQNRVQTIEASLRGYQDN